MYEVLLLFCAFVLWVVYSTVHPKGFPPGNEAHTISLWFQERVWAKVTLKMMKDYGPITGHVMLGTKIVVASGKEAVCQVLTHKQLEYRPVGPIAKAMYKNLKGSVLFANGDWWQKHRSTTVRQMRDFGFGKNSMETTLLHEALYFVADLKEKMKNSGDRKVRVYEVYELPMMNCLWILIIGYRFKYDDEELKTLWSLLNNASKAVFRRGGALSLFPWLRYIMPGYTGYNDIMKFVEYFYRFLEGVLKAHHQSYIPGIKRDFIDACIEEHESNNLEGVVTVDKIFGNCMDFLIAGVDTNICTLSFTTLYMMLNPEVQTKVQQEIDDVIGKGVLPQLEDMKRLPYTMATILEVQRMGSVIAFPSRMGREDVEIMNYKIPKNTAVFINMYSVHMEEAYWGDPKVFRPERFLNEKGEVVQDDHLLNFGIGKRRCLGELFAKNVLFLFITTLLQNFSFKIPAGCTPPSIEDIEDGIAIHPVPFDAYLEERC